MPISWTVTSRLEASKLQCTAVTGNYVMSIVLEGCIS